MNGKWRIVVCHFTTVLGGLRRIIVSVPFNPAHTLMAAQLLQCMPSFGETHIAQTDIPIMIHLQYCNALL